jgi:putative DNA primase/helicase
MADQDDKVVPIARGADIRKKKKNSGWHLQLLRKRGQLIPTIMNAIAILANDDAWEDVLGYDLMAEAVVALKTPPWHPTDRTARDAPGAWRDVDTTRTASWLARMHNLYLHSGTVRDAIEIVARKKSFHPIRSWFEKLEWDGHRRADTLLVRHAHVRDSKYVRAVTGKWLISAVARVMNPGCKADHVLVLEGEQRVGKSLFFRTLTGNDDWYLETGVDFGSREAMQVISRKWIVELAELDSIGRAALSRTKQFITTQVDTFRPPYGREVVNRPRMCVLGGTINDFEYLRDDTGGGRWWGCRSAATLTNKINIKAIASEREQIFAEVFARWKKGEPWHLTNYKVIGLAADEQEDRRVQDPWEPRIAKALASPKLRAEGTTTYDLLTKVIGLSYGELARAQEMRMGCVLRTLGWQRTARRTDQRRVYMPRDPAVK